MKTFISDCGFSFFSVNPLFYSALFFTDCNCSRTNVLRVRNWSSQCRTCVVPPPPTYVLERLLRDVKGTATSKWHCWSWEAGTSPAPLLSALPASSTKIRSREKGCERWPLVWGQTISAAARRSDDSLPYCRYLMMYAELEQVGGITYNNLVAASKYWRCETLPEASVKSTCSSFQKCQRPSALPAFFHNIVFYSLPPCWLSSRHKGYNKTLRLQEHYHKYPQFFHPLDTGPFFYLLATVDFTVSNTFFW